MLRTRSMTSRSTETFLRELGFTKPTITDMLIEAYFLRGQKLQYTPEISIRLDPNIVAHNPSSARYIIEIEPEENRED